MVCNIKQGKRNNLKAGSDILESGVYIKASDHALWVVAVAVELVRKLRPFSTVNKSTETFVLVVTAPEQVAAKHPSNGSPSLQEFGSLAVGLLLFRFS